MNENKKNYSGLLAVGAFGIAATGLLFGSIPFVLPALRKICLPYVPATDKQVKNVMKLLQKRKGNVIDLGSGDGRIVFSAAKLGFCACGIELNPWLVVYSQIKAIQLGLSKQTTFKWQDIWKTDLRNFDNVVIFGVDQMMPQLQKKLLLELKKDGCVIACRYPFPHWPVSLSLGTGIDQVWMYEKKTHINA